MLFSPKNIAFGLDIGDKSIKMAEVRLTKNIKGETSLMLANINEIPVPEGTFVNGEVKNSAAAAKAIIQCAKKMRGRYLITKGVIASLPESQCYLKIIPPMPADASKNADLFIQKNLTKHFPVNADQVYYDYRILDDGRILIGIAPKAIADSFTNIIEQAGFAPLALEIEGIAIARALTRVPREATAKKEHDNADETARPKILMDLGATRSTIIAVERGDTVAVTLNIPLSGDNMTREISKVEKISFDEAEKIKIACGFDTMKCAVKTKKIIQSLIKDAAQEIKTGIQYINNNLNGDGAKVEKIYISGGVASMLKLASVLSEKLGVKVRHADPFINVRRGKKITIANEELLKYATAIGLAMRGTETDLLNIDNNNS